jgi:hypothetical protein
MKAKKPEKNYANIRKCLGPTRAKSAPIYIRIHLVKDNNSQFSIFSSSRITMILKKLFILMNYTNLEYKLRHKPWWQSQRFSSMIILSVFWHLIFPLKDKSRWQPHSIKGQQLVNSFFPANILPNKVKNFKRNIRSSKICSQIAN